MVLTVSPLLCAFAIQAKALRPWLHITKMAMEVFGRAFNPFNLVTSNKKKYSYQYTKRIVNGAIVYNNHRIW